MSVGLILEDALGNFHDQLISLCTENIHILKNPTFCPQNVFVSYNSHKCMRLLSSNYNREVFGIETECVYCAVRTESCSCNVGFDSVLVVFGVKGGC